VKKSVATTVYITGLSSIPEFDALPDDYETAAGVSLAVAAPGVLVNDQDPDGESITAVLVAPTAHGTLVLNADGSFVYTPDAGFTGTDTFVYKAQDEVGAFRYPTIVTITVRP
jgi:VCBS repeat-containing protein